MTAVLRHMLPAFLHDLIEGADGGSLAPAIDRRDAALRLAPLKVQTLLGSRKTLKRDLVAAADDDRAWASAAVQLQQVERELRALAPALDTLLAPKFGSAKFTWRLEGKRPPSGIADAAAAWIGAAIDARVLRPFGAVPLKLIGLGDNRPFALGGTVHVRSDTPPHVYVHELGHLVEERLRPVAEATMALYATEARGQRVQVSQLYRRWKQDDWVRVGFADPYWGREPMGTSTEVISGAFGALAYSPGLLFVSDPTVYGLGMAVMAGDYLR